MSDPKHTRPHLVAVGDPAKEAPETAPEVEHAEEARGRGIGFWLLLAVAVAVTAGLLVQIQRAGELRGTIATLEGELFTTRTALEAYEARFEEVRDSVGGLRSQLDALNALVAADPLEASPETPAEAPSTPEAP